MSSKTVVKALFRELSKHHEYAFRLQAKEVHKAEVARQTLAKRSGNLAEASKPIEEYKMRALEPSIVDKYKLEELREDDVIEITDFLQHQRQYKELLERYSSGPEDTIERVNATAKRVGLDASKL